MSRNQRIAAFVFAVWPLSAALLPEGLELHSRKLTAPLVAADPALWKEYGFQEGESAVYEGKGKADDKGVFGPMKTFSVSAWRLRDSTSALALWQLLRPTDAKPVAEAATNVAARSGGRLLLAYGNYVLQFEGYTPENETVHQLVLHLPRFERAALPALAGFLPVEARVANSERLIVGPVGLERFAGQVPPSVVAFQYDTEGVVGRFVDRDGPVDLVVFAYPNHQIAQKQIAAYQNLAGLTASRNGPLVGVVLKTPNADAAQRVLAQVRYEATITINSKPAAPKENIGDMILAIAQLAGVLIGGALVAGLLFAGIRLATGGGFGNIRGRQEEVVSLSIDRDVSKRP